MKKHISYPKIYQFRNTVANINRQVTYVGNDEAGDPIYDPSIPKPKLKAKGTVKLHGTNAGISYNDQNGLWVQSREKIITVEKDNAGFAFFVESNKDSFIDLIDSIKRSDDIDTSEYTISMYGEWAGKGIQKGVGISNIEKSFFIFSVKISKPQDSEFAAYWIDSSIFASDNERIFNIEEFPTYEVEIDFNIPELSVPEFERITNEIEAECPVAKSFGISGIGEGAVYTIEYKGTVQRFKIKGQKHSVSKVKKLASVDVEKMNSIMEFVDYSVTKNRFDQAIEKVFERKENMDVKQLGNFIRWVVNDIASEEMDTMTSNNLEPKDVNKYISTRVREMFFKEYDIV